jgi:predicted adenylyl cyclase CyaB
MGASWEGFMSSFEIEQKYRISNPNKIRERLKQLKAKKIASGHEYNALYDFQGKLRAKGKVIRLRSHRKGEGVLTFKGPRMEGKYKKRIEVETPVDFEAAKKIFELMGLEVIAEYSKKREEYTIGKTHVTLDQLKGIGWFAEIEGTENHIQALEKKLGLTEKDQEHRTYVEITAQE